MNELMNPSDVSLQVLVTPLTDRGFLFLLSSVQMTTPAGKTPQMMSAW